MMKLLYFEKPLWNRNKLVFLTHNYFVKPTFITENFALERPKSESLNIVMDNGFSIIHYCYLLYFIAK
jgi:hypothetical protein